MGYDLELKEEIIDVIVKKEPIDGNEEGNELVFLEFDKYGNISINLSTNGTEDIDSLFNYIFNKMIQDKVLIKFNLLENEKPSLHYEVAQDILERLNGEINDSKDNIEKIIFLLNEEIN